MFLKEEKLTIYLHQNENFTHLIKILNYFFSFHHIFIQLQY